MSGSTSRLKEGKNLGRRGHRICRETNHELTLLQKWASVTNHLHNRSLNYIAGKFVLEATRPCACIYHTEALSTTRNSEGNAREFA